MCAIRSPARSESFKKFMRGAFAFWTEEELGLTFLAWPTSPYTDRGHSPGRGRTAARPTADWPPAGNPAGGLVFPTSFARVRILRISHPLSAIAGLAAAAVAVAGGAVISPTFDGGKMAAKQLSLACASTTQVPFSPGLTVVRRAARGKKEPPLIRRSED